MNKLTIKITLLGFFLLGITSLLHAQFYPATPLAGKTLTQDFIEQNLQYPDEALQAKLSGTVVVAFTVDDHGQGSGYHVSESFCEAANDNALDLVRKIQWNPATQEMKPVTSEMEYAIEYHAKSYRRYWKKHERVAVPLTLEADTSYRIYNLHALEEAAKPYFANGTSMAQYLLNNLKYPEAARAGEIYGTVRLRFVVEADGAVSNIVVEQSVGGGCDNEAIRLLQETHWIPAVKNGKYVRSFNQQDITFNIGNRNYLDGNAY